MKYETVIVGGGVMGCAAAHYLSKTQKNILLLDQYEIENGLNSSQDLSRVFRYVYGADEMYPLMAVESLKLWKELEKESKTQLYFQCGCLLLGRAPGSYSAKSFQTMKKLGLEAYMLNGSKFKENFPQFNVDAGLFDPAGGVIEASTAVNTFIRLAHKNGVMIRPQTKVKCISEKKITLEDGTKIDAEKIIVTAGIWTRKLLGDQIKIAPSRQELIYFEPKNKDLFRKEKFPTFGHLESGFYGIPIHKMDAVKIANHNPGAAVDPDSVDRRATNKFIDECRKFLRDYIPDLADGRVIKTKVCMYDMTRDEDFIIDSLSENIVIGTGFSGHGFKFAPLIGKILAELSLQGKTTRNISRFGLRRDSL